VPELRSTAGIGGHGGQGHGGGHCGEHLFLLLEGRHAVMVMQQNVAHFVAEHCSDFIFAADVVQHAQRHEHIAVRVRRGPEAVAVGDFHLQGRQLPRPTFGQARDNPLQIHLQHRDIHQVLLACFGRRYGAPVIAQALLALALRVELVVLAHVGVIHVVALDPGLGRRTHQVQERLVGALQCRATTEYRAGQ